MASVNKVSICEAELRALYVEQKRSTPEVAAAFGTSISTVRSRLKEMGILRSRGDAIRIAAAAGKLGAASRGKKRHFTDLWRLNISRAANERAESTAKGWSKKPNGYIEITRGQNKGRSVHVVTVEQILGRRLAKHEVVHHIDHDRSNNKPENLQVMSRAEHTAMHAAENVHNRKRKPNGQFE